MKRSDLIKSMPPKPMKQDTKDFLIFVAVIVGAAIFHTMLR